MAMHYTLDDGCYVLHEGVDGDFRPVPLVAFAYGATPKSVKPHWVLYRHGDPDVVRPWTASTRTAFKKAGVMGKAMARELHLLEGTLNLLDLNAALESPEAVEALVANSLAQARRGDEGFVLFLDGEMVVPS